MNRWREGELPSIYGYNSLIFQSKFHFLVLCEDKIVLVRVGYSGRTGAGEGCYSGGYDGLDEVNSLT